MERTKAPSFTRATLAKAAGVGAETLRFYEKKGIIQPPGRTASGYRIYEQGDLDRLQFIQRAQGLGFSLEEIKELLALTGDIKTPRRKVREFAGARLSTIRQKIKALRAMERALSALVDECDGSGPLKGCPIAEFVGGKTNKSIGGCHEA
jgi:MerR family copper efflux transcriptional regulator